MRILYLCHRIPYPPNKGDKIRAFHQIRAMSEKHEVDVFTLIDDPEDLNHTAELKKYCRRLTVARVHPPLARLRALSSLFSHKPMTLPYFHSAELAAEVRNSLRGETYDRIFVYCSAMAQYIEAVDKIPVVIDFVDVDSDKWMQYANSSRFPFSVVYRREGRLLRDLEQKICGKAACAVVSTEREAKLLREIAGPAIVHAIPNGVDTAYFDSAIVPPEKTLPTIVFTGDMSYFPNQEAATYFAREVLPLIRRSITQARFIIVGRNPSRSVQRLKEVDGVEVTGFVPDVRTYLAQAHVAVAPFSIAAGIQNKILEAMSYGLPVVATSRATQGLSAVVAELVDTADTTEAMATSVVRLLLHPDSASRRGLLARERVAAEYRWDNTLNRLLSLLTGQPLEVAISST